LLQRLHKKTKARKAEKAIKTENDLFLFLQLIQQAEARHKLKLQTVSCAVV
jgi:hypothetical protein